MADLQASGWIVLDERVDPVADAADLEVDPEILDDLVQVGEHVGLIVVRDVVEIVEDDQHRVVVVVVLRVAERLADQHRRGQEAIHLGLLHTRLSGLRVGAGPVRVGVAAEAEDLLDPSLGPGPRPDGVAAGAELSDNPLGRLWSR